MPKNLTADTLGTTIGGELTTGLENFIQPNSESIPANQNTTSETNNPRN